MSDERQEQFFLDQKEIEESLKICREIQEFNKKDRHKKKREQMNQGTRKEIDKILNSLQKEMKQDADTSERLEESIRPARTQESSRQGVESSVQGVKTIKPVPEAVKRAVAQKTEESESVPHEPEGSGKNRAIREIIPDESAETDNRKMKKLEKEKVRKEKPGKKEKAEKKSRAEKAEKKKAEKRAKAEKKSRKNQIVQPQDPEESPVKASASVTDARPAAEAPADGTGRPALHLEKVANAEKFEEVPDAEVEAAYEAGNVSEEAYNERHPLLNALVRILICVVAAILLAVLITRFVAHHTSVEGSSMETTLTSGDQLIVENISYYFHNPERFDVVVFPFDDNTNYIKRVIGLPGETVQIKNGYVYINGEILDENYGRDSINDPGIAANEIHLGTDEYFVLGDNRNASVDSRDPEVGLIHGSDIRAKAWLCFYPFSQVRFVE